MVVGPKISIANFMVSFNENNMAMQGGKHA
jgi:hypothetical protein